MKEGISRHYVLHSEDAKLLRKWLTKSNLSEQKGQSLPDHHKKVNEWSYDRQHDEKVIQEVRTTRWIG